MREYLLEVSRTKALLEVMVEQHLTQHLMLDFDVICHPSVYQDIGNVLEIQLRDCL